MSHFRKKNVKKSLLVFFSLKLRHHVTEINVREVLEERVVH
jgi:hypothetical protein